MLKTHEQPAFGKEQRELTFAPQDRLLYLKVGEIMPLDGMVDLFFRGTRIVSEGENHHQEQGFLFDEAEASLSDEREDVEFAVDAITEEQRKIA